MIDVSFMHPALVPREPIDAICLTVCADVKQTYLIDYLATEPSPLWMVMPV